GWQRSCYRSLATVHRRETCPGDFRCLGRVILPVVIRDQERSVIITKLQRWVLEQGRAAAPARYARVDTTDHNVVAAVVTGQDDARDDNGVTRGDKSAGADVGQFGRDGRTKIV